MGFKKVSLYLSWFAILSSFMFACISAAQISEADLLTLTKQEIDNDLESKMLIFFTNVIIFLSTIKFREFTTAFISE